MDEYLDIADKFGHLTGKSELKSIVHQKGLYHHTAHIWFYTKNGYILLAQRSASKSICPLMWDVSVAGHVDSGESIIKGAIRECKEEIGLTLSEDEMHKIGVFECFQNYNNGTEDNEFHNTYIAELKVPLTKLTPQIEEVAALKLVSCLTFEELLAQSETNNHFVASNRPYYKKVLQSILDKI